jgi:diguanylate cyclase
MVAGLSAGEGRVLRALLEDAAGDIVLRLDRSGFIAEASARIADLGLDSSASLLPPHITDLTGRDHAGLLGQHVSAVLAGRDMTHWIEFPITTCGNRGECSQPQCQHWYALSLSPLRDDSGAVEGAVGLIRSIHQTRSLEGALHARCNEDAVTGLANRAAFCAQLRRGLARGGGQMVVVLALDGMRALNLRYGQKIADELQWGFARFAEGIALPDTFLARLDDERIGAILNGLSRDEARRWCTEAMEVFAALASPAAPRAERLTVSAGLAWAERSVDWTLRHAELGLVMARAGGGNCVAEAPLSGQFSAGTTGLVSRAG